MFDIFAWTVALRQLRYGIVQTLLTMGVVAISVTLIIFLGSLIGGLQRRLIADITGSIPHIVISQPERYPIPAWQVPSLQREGTLYVGRTKKVEQRRQRIEDWQIWLPRLQNFDPDISAVSPVVEGQAILSRGESQQGVSVTGIIPERHDLVVDIQSKIVAGTFSGLGTGDIAIGYVVADDLGVRVGDKVRLSTSTGSSAIFTLAGIFDTGAEPIDRSAAYIPLKDAQSLFGYGTAVTSIDIKLTRIFEANNIADRMILQVPYQVDSWMRENQQLLSALQAQSLSANLILFFTTVAAGFGIASILITSVTSKLREIGILRAIGVTRRQIIAIFTIQSTLMSTLGGLVGSPLGILVSLSLLRYRTQASETGRQTALFPIEIRWQLVLGSMGIAVAIGFLASLYPAWRASKVNPIEVIRGA